MKAKKLFKKPIAYFLVFVLIVIAVPMSMFASASDPVNAAENATLVTGTLTGRSADLSHAAATFSGLKTVDNVDKAVNASSGGTGLRDNKIFRWDGILADLSKGSITFEADLMAYGKDDGNGYEIFSGYSPVKVNGRYVFVGPGAHTATYNSWKAYMFVDAANLNEGNATPALLGSSYNANQGGWTKSLTTGSATKIHIKVELTSTGFTASYDDVASTNVTFPAGATIEPAFIWKWCGAVADNYLTNVKIYGDGVVELKNLAGESTVSKGKMNGRSKDLSVTASFSNPETTPNDDKYEATGAFAARANKYYMWDQLDADLSKGAVVFEADVVVYGDATATGWEVFQGWSPVKVNGHYVFAGVGTHAAGYNGWTPWLYVDTANLNEGNATPALLGSSYNASQSGWSTTLSADNPTTIKMKVILTATSLTAYYDGKIATTVTFPNGATVEPAFIWKWDKATEKSYLSNVKIYGVGLGVIYDVSGEATITEGQMGGRSKDLSVTPSFISSAATDNDDKYEATGAFSSRANRYFKWDGFIADLSKGFITFEADIVVYGDATATGWEVFQGWSPVKVNGHYVFAGVGTHAAGYNGWTPWLYVDTANLNEGNATPALLGSSYNASQSGWSTTLSADNPTTIKMKVVLTATGFTAYYDGKLATTVTFPSGATVEPAFIWKWDKATEASYLTNVKIFGLGVAPIVDLASTSTVSKGTMNGRSKDLSVTASFSTLETTPNDDKYEATGAFAARANKYYKWDQLEGNLSKGSIIFEADIVAYGDATATGWEVFQGWSPVKVNGHYVFAGVGTHAAGYNGWTPWLYVDTANLNEGNATPALLGSSYNASQSGWSTTLSADNPTTIKMKVVLTANGFTAYYDGKLATTVTFPSGATVEPAFIWKWDKATVNSYLTNVKIYGDGVDNPLKDAYFDVTFKGENGYGIGSISNKFETIANETPGYVVSRNDITNVSLDADSKYEYCGTFTIDKTPLTGSKPSWTGRIIIGKFMDGDVERTLYANFVPYWCQAWIGHDGSFITSIKNGDKGGDPRLWDGTAGDYSITAGVELACSTNYTSITYKVEYNNGKMNIYINDVEFIMNWNIVSDFPTFTPAFGGFAVIGANNDTSETTATMLEAAPTVTLKDFYIVSEDLETIDSVVDGNGNGVYVADFDLVNNEVVLDVEAESGYTLAIDKTTYSDGTSTRFLANYLDDTDKSVYVVPYIKNAEITAVFYDETTQNFSFGVIGTQLHLNAIDSPDGIRFLNRFYISANKQTVQTENAITVVYNGITYKVTDYGVIANTKANLSGELTMDNYYLKGEAGEFKASAINNYIYGFNDSYVDVTCVIMPEEASAAFNECEYVVRGYMVLTPDEGKSITIYGNEFVDSVNAAAQRIGL